MMYGGMGVAGGGMDMMGPTTGNSIDWLLIGVIVGSVILGIIVGIILGKRAMRKRDI
jgi:hypothetical protein